MKSKKIYFLGILSFLFAGILLNSCTKSFDQKTTQLLDLNSQSIVQVYMATVNANRNFIYVDGNPVTGALMTSGSLFPSSGYGFSLNGGVRSFLIRDTLSATTQIPFTFSQNMQAGKNYTVFLYDSITAPNQKTVFTNITIPTDTSARIRFANFVHAKTAIPAIDIFSVRRNANVVTNLQITDVTDFIPFSSRLTDTFYVRIAGSGTNLMNITPPPPTSIPGNVLTPITAILTPTAKRSYTIVFRGSYTTTLTNALQVRALSSFANY